MPEEQKCYVCLEGDDARKGDVNRYRRYGRDSGFYHVMCALLVGFNEWEAE